MLECEAAKARVGSKKRKEERGTWHTLSAVAAACRLRFSFCPLFLFALCTCVRVSVCLYICMRVCVLVYVYARTCVGMCACVSVLVFFCAISGKQ